MIWLRAAPLRSAISAIAATYSFNNREVSSGSSSWRYP